jgi:hypothetical protein
VRARRGCSSPDFRSFRSNIHPAIHPQGGCHSTYAATMLCSSGLGTHSHYLE